MLSEIILPNSYNYCGVFLSLKCNLRCPYCINRQGELKNSTELTGEQWIEGLSRIKTTEDFPITLQGGEPTMYRDFYKVVENLHGKHLDLLTNGKFNTGEFMGHVHSGIFNRKKSPYISIRMSYHKGQNDWYITDKIGVLKSAGYNLGVFGLSHVDNKMMKDICKSSDVTFTEKEYLDKTHGKYKYPEALSGIPRTVLCKPSELLIAPDGKLYRCHSELYSGINSYGNILDEEVNIPTDFAKCDRFGICNSCDFKWKTNRLLEKNHCSVEIKEC